MMVYSDVNSYAGSLLMTLEIGLLTNGASLSLETNRGKPSKRSARSRSLLEVYTLMLENMPETLTSLVIMSAKVNLRWN